MAFSPDYIRFVLADNFEDAKALFLEPLIAIHFAHLVMLADTGIVSSGDARTIAGALRGIDLDRVRRAAYDGSSEDLFFYVDRLLADACGADAAGRLHTARSRNDIDMALYRMRLRGALLDLGDAILEARRVLLEHARAHRESVYPAHTHTQPAQPTTVAHYLLAVIEQLERDTARVLAAYVRTNLCPLGACAITGTGFPIDRARTSALLGFAAPTGNTYGSIATVDYLLESAAAASVTVVGLGRFVQDMLFWCTSEVGYLRLADGFVQVSSIMPQKRNPVALEHARALLSKAFAGLQAVAAAVHNTPFGDIVDTEDDLQPLGATAFRDAHRAVALVAAAMADATFNVGQMRARAGQGWVTLTELADVLTREHGLPFRASHAIAARLVHERTGNADAPLSEIIARASRDIAGREVRLTDAGAARLLDPDHFVRVRRTPGGPAPDESARAIARAADLVEQDAAALSDARARLADAARALDDAVDILTGDK